MPGRTYKIGEAAKLLGLESHVLRFWEMEFPQIHPARTAKGQRIYSEADIATLQRIQNLLHEQGMTIDGARRMLDEEKTECTPAFLPNAEYAEKHIACDDACRLVLHAIEQELLQMQERLRKT